jgi:hypothetical protein
VVGAAHTGKGKACVAVQFQGVDLIKHAWLLLDLIFCQADKLLSPEFQPIISQLISFLPPDRQIMLYRQARHWAPPF